MITLTLRAEITRYVIAALILTLLIMKQLA
jgi:hypothetical protein